MDTSYLSHRFLDEVMGMSADTRRKYSEALTLIINTGAKPEAPSKILDLLRRSRRKGGVMGKKKKPTIKDQLDKLENVVCDIADQIAFLSVTFGSGIPPHMEENHFSGLSVLLNHVHQDSYKVFDLVAEMEDQIEGS